MLENRFIITISDISGSRHFYLNRIIKKIVLYIIAFAFLFLISSGFYIKYLDSKVDMLDAKREELLKRSKELEALNMTVQQSPGEKAVQYAVIEDKIVSFEEALELENENNLTISARLKNLNLTNNQRQGILNQIPNGWPITSKDVTGKFGWKEHPILKRKGSHPDIDLAASISTSIYASASGVVEFSGYSNNGHGYNVILLHNFGFKSVFAYMTRRGVVKAGDFVSKGDLIGYTGNTGLSTGPHLHYEVRFINKTLEPLYFLNLKGKNMDEFFNQERRVPWQSLIKAASA